MSPFSSKRQMRFLYARHPKIARKFVREARRQHKPIVKKPRRR